MVAAGLPVATTLMTSASKLAPVPDCGLSNTAIGAKFINGRITGNIMAAIVLARLALSTNGKSQTISRSNSFARFTSLSVGLSLIGDSVNPGAAP
jgi:hypothetical protein